MQAAGQSRKKGGFQGKPGGGVFQSGKAMTGNPKVAQIWRRGGGGNGIFLGIWRNSDLATDLHEGEA